MREQWKEWEYFLVSLGASIGFGCVWRFPFLLFEGGGGSFILPFLTCAFGFISPVLELLILQGQSYNVGLYSMYKRVHPKYSGIATSKCLYCILVSSYYVYLLSYNIIFFIKVIFGELPWINSPLDSLLKDISAYVDNEIFYSDPK